MMPFWRGILLSILLSHAPILSANEAEYVVRYVYDGDTVKLVSAGLGKHEAFKLRIADIDAPERNQSYGQKSRRALLKLCQGKDIQVRATLTDYDQYGRQIGNLYCNHVNAGLYLVEQGLAWHPAKFSQNEQLRHAAAQAQSRRTGLWQQSNPTPPWVWRKLHAKNKIH
jgi:micrococcal nuclease